MSSRLGQFESEINDQFGRWWKENAKSGKQWENKEGFRNAFFEGRVLRITKSEEYKELKDVLKECTDHEFVVVVDEILNCLRVEMDRRKVRIIKSDRKCREL